MNIDAKTKLYCIFGNPVRHSLSPIMHNEAFKSLNLNKCYLAFEPESISNAISAMKSLNIYGASVTIPFKTDVIDYIDEIDPLALKIGAVNTLINNKSRITGLNTDGLGAYKAIKNIYPEINGANILIIGSGGSARAIAITLLEFGCYLTIAGRYSERHKNFVKFLKQSYENVEIIDTNKLKQSDLNRHKVIINTTSLGMNPDKDPIPIDTSFINESHIVFDIVYAPHNTPLLMESQNNGAKVIYGIEMLLNQGAEQFKLWTGLDAPIDLMRTILTKNLYK